MDKPVRCPWCGIVPWVGPIGLHKERTQFEVGCEQIKCPVQPSTTYFDTREEAIAAWNTCTDPLRDRLVEALTRLLRAAESIYCTKDCTPEECAYAEARAVLAEEAKRHE